MNSLSALANQNEITYGTLANTAVVTYFGSQSVEPYKKMYDFMVREHSNVPSTSVAIKKLHESYGKPKSKYFYIYQCCTQKVRGAVGWVGGVGG